MDAQRAGTGYLAVPEGEQGPGVLVLHAWWGLTDHIRRECDRLAVEGFVALAPDLFDGAVATEVAEAEQRLATADADALAHLTRSGLRTLRDLTHTPEGPVGVVGYSMGASMALWLAARVSASVAATAVFYGDQEIDMADATCAFLGHFAEDDSYVDDDTLALLEADLHLDEREVEFHRDPGTRHWFAEPDRPEHDPAATDLAWQRTVRFLHRHLDT
jgi:carboxymethylenebutenolidase